MKLEKRMKSIITITNILRSRVGFRAQLNYVDNIISLRLLFPCVGWSSADLSYMKQWGHYSSDPCGPMNLRTQGVGSPVDPSSFCAPSGQLVHMLLPGLGFRSQLLSNPIDSTKLLVIEGEGMFPSRRNIFRQIHVHRLTLPSGSARMLWQPSLTPIPSPLRWGAGRAIHMALGRPHQHHPCPHSLVCEMGTYLATGNQWEDWDLIWVSQT